MNEFILCASVMYKGTIVSGRRHHNCYTILRELGHDEEPIREDQGFLTSLGRHVSREEGFLIAKKNNQIFHKMYDNDNTGSLTSEDLYYDDKIDDI